MLRYPAGVIALYGFTIFLSAALLFMVQPMIARMVLPRLGGSPSVWNACMLFFQTLLLLAYGYAHVATERLGPRRQGLGHIVVVVAAFALLPVALPAGSPGSWPMAWLLMNLAIACAGPFFLLATTSPLLQRWLADTRHPLASNPYVLYIASNAGSLIGLIAYPLVVEPVMTLTEQSALASWGLLVVGGLHLLCVWMLRRSAPPLPAGPAPRAASSARPGKGGVKAGVRPARGEAVGAAPAAKGREVWRERLVWGVLSFIPSSLLLGVTQHLSTDIVAMPLLWVVPLALYLVTFMLAFGSRGPAMVAPLARLFAISACSIALIMVIEARKPVAVVVLFHILTFFLGALLCHARLSAAKPEASRLTEFYLVMAVGGVLGGLFNAIVAPVVFVDVFEYPLALVLVAAVRPGAGRRPGVLDGVIPALVAAYIVAVNTLVIDPVRTGYIAAGALAGGVPAVSAFLCSVRRVGFAATLAVVLAATFVYPRGFRERLYSERTFFGVYRVARTMDGSAISLLHGTTIHGEQPLRDGERQPIASTYYHPRSPIGRIFEAGRGDPRFRRVGLVGMGVGSLAAYAEEGARLTFHEIDPAIVRIASDPALFTYLSESAGEWDVKLGDGRRTMEDVPDGTYGVIVLDAFTSDAIPVHLMTVEAFELYKRKLAPGGLLAVHISNRYLDLRPIVTGAARRTSMALFACNHGFPDEFNGRIAELAEGLSRSLASGGEEASRVIADEIQALERERDGLARERLQASVWMVLCKRAEDFSPPEGEPRFMRLLPRPEAPYWTDDYSNILSTFRW